MSEPQPIPKKSFLLNNKTFQTAFVYLVAAAALCWVFHDVNFGSLKKEFFHIVWPLALLGMLVDIGRYVTQTIRWNLLLSPFGRISLLKTFQTLYAGIFLNLILPLRVGEVARAYLASRFSGARFWSVVSSMAVEYLFDGIWFAAGIGIVALMVPLPGNVLVAARIIGAAAFAAAALFVFLVFFKRGGPNAAPARKGIFGSIVHFLDTTRKGLQVIGRTHRFWASLFVSSFDIMFHIVAFWILLHAYGIRQPLIVAAAVLLFIFVGLIIPNAPSNVGSFQFLCVLGLLAFGVDKTTAGGFSVFFFVMVNIPQVVIGWISFMKSGEKLGEIRARVASLRLSNKE